MTDPTPLHQATPVELKARLAAEREGQPFLLYTDDAGRQQIVVLDAERQGRVIVGRGSEVEVNLEWDTDVSRLHAEIEHLGGRWTVADDGLSRNGTYLNGERLRGRRRLAERDRLRFGATNVAFRAPVAARPTTTQGTSIGVDAPPPAITAAQKRVLLALARPVLAEGSYATPATNRQIAEELFLSIDAVKTHLRALTVRFGIADLPQNRKRARLVELALQNGAISERDLEDTA
jgi:pSer/pThr/pTyr-binding forkhead associated (FHA) protein